MGEKPHRSETIIGAYEDYAHACQRRPQWIRLTVTGGIGSPMEIDHHWKSCRVGTSGGPHIQIEAVFVPADIWKPGNGQLRAGGSVCARLAYARPRCGRLWRLPTQFAD